MKSLNWGIIGCGDVTERKSGPAFNLVDNSSIVAVMRRNVEKAKDYAQRHNVQKWYGNADELIQDPNVNAVYVATPPDTHLLYAQKAMEAGKPVYVEKPMARNFQECLEMINTAEKTQVPLSVAYYRRRLPLFVKVKDIVDSGEIGDVVFVNVNMISNPKPGDSNSDKPWRVIPEISGGGHFVDLASHQFDFFQYVLGDSDEINSVVTNKSGLYTAEDTVSAQVKYKSGPVFSGNWTFAQQGYEDHDEVTIIGTKGKLQFSTFTYLPLKIKTTTGEKEMDFDWPENIQLPLITEVVDYFLGKGPNPTPGNVCAESNKIIDLILKDYYLKTK